jgi:hypothetical protein
MAHKLGAFGYAEPASFDPNFDHAWFMRVISKEEKRSSETFVTHYRTTFRRC